MKKSFATAINCIDGRAQKPVTEFAIRKFKVDYVDLITEPGPDKVLSENKALDIIGSIKRCTLISVEKHKSKIVIIAGHHDCAANPVEEEEHYRQIKEAVKNIKEWNLEVDVYGVWVDKNWEAVLL
ncbi:MAG: carbonic anhydrase [Candidatus Omnitrophota bacterium]